MNVYMTRARAQKMAELLAQSRKISDFRVDCKRCVVSAPDRTKDIGWVAKVVSRRGEMFA